MRNPAHSQLTSHINSNLNREDMDIYIMHRITNSLGANMRMDTYQLYLNTNA